MLNTDEEVINDKDETISQQNVDELTLELLTNKRKFKNNNFIDNEDKNEKNIVKYKRQILDITMTLLNNPKEQITKDVNNIFNAYALKLIEYLQFKDVEMNNESNENYQKDEDMLFEKIDEPIDQMKNEPQNSVWGNNIRKGDSKESKKIASYNLKIFSKR